MQTTSRAKNISRDDSNEENFKLIFAIQEKQPQLMNRKGVLLHHYNVI